MKKTEHMIPFIDIVFQALGVLIVAAATMQHVSALPVNLATVSKDVRVAKRSTKPVFVVLSKKGLFFGKKKATLDSIKRSVDDKEVIFRVDKDVSYGNVVEVISGMQDSAKNIALEVKKNG